MIGLKKQIRLLQMLSLMLLSIISVSSAIAQASLSHHATAPVIIEMVRYSSKLANPDLTPAVRIFSDASVEIYRPVYFKQAGLYRGQLDKQQFNQILSQFDALQQFDPELAEDHYVSEDLAHSRSTGELFYVSEQVITQFTIQNNSQFSALPNLMVAENAQLKASRFPGLSEWQAFATAEKSLMDLGGQLQLTRVADAKNQ